MNYLTYIATSYIRKKIYHTTKNLMFNIDTVAFNHPMPNAKSQFMDKLETQAVIDL